MRKKAKRTTRASSSSRRRTAARTPDLIKPNAGLPALQAQGGDKIAIRAGVCFRGRKFSKLTALPRPAAGYEPGADYLVIVDAKAVRVEKAEAAPGAADILGGFHFAPGGRARAREGGDAVPAINPFSLWDQNFRPAAKDPRGMALCELNGVPFWVDIYLLGRDHLRDGTSKFGVTIADGNATPRNPAGGDYPNFNFATAQAVMAHHGKALLSVDEFREGALGVKELTACGSDPEITKLDAPRTSKFGLMQATGNLWVWCHDGDPDKPRASIAGGSWHDDGFAGSRYARVDYWPGSSRTAISAPAAAVTTCNLICRRDSAGVAGADAVPRNFGIPSSQPSRARARGEGFHLPQVAGSGYGAALLVTAALVLASAFAIRALVVHQGQQKQHPRAPVVAQTVKR